MKDITSNKKLYATCILLTASFLMSCASIDPATVDIEIAKTHPIPKITSYTQALMDLGLMSEIYDTRTLKIQSIPIGDNTGSSFPTEGEMPKDISEMVKSALNSIGGNLIYIPYDPSFVQNQVVTGYSNFQNKLIPDVVISGGITEFDRGLETREANTDASSQIEYEGLPNYLPGMQKQVPYPSKNLNLRFGGNGQIGLARITLDFNMLNFQTMSGIPRMTTVNSIEVQKGAKEKEWGISIFAQAFGRKGKIKKVQGRHAAIRLLVEISMIQMVGRQLIIPYWKLLGNDALPDRVVLDSASAFYHGLNQNQKIAFTQQQLFLHGYDIPINGSLDEESVVALQDFFKTDTPPDIIDFDNFVKIWSSIPITKETLKRRNFLRQVQKEQATLEQQQRPRQKKKPARKQRRKRQAVSVVQKSNQEAVEKLLTILEQKKREQLLRLLEEKK